jgi:alpha-galactosidase
MPKITFLGAGSTVFAKNILGDCMLTESLADSHYALYDIDARRLEESRLMLETLRRNLGAEGATISAHLDVGDRRKALEGADYVVNAIQVGGYEPSTVIDFEIPRRYGLLQTIGDTLGIGGIFRALRTIPVVLDIAHDMEAVCPRALFLNYVNPMAMITGALLEHTAIRSVGLCHSVQSCARGLLRGLGLLEGVRRLQWRIAGINHQAWLLEITDGGVDLYPRIKQLAAARNLAARKPGAPKHYDMVRFEIMRRFGYYVTESSEHSAEYMPYWIKRLYPGLVEEMNIPLDEYPRRCVAQIEDWKRRSAELVSNPTLNHTRTQEYGAYIMDAVETDRPFRIHGNVANRGYILNLPARTCVEVPCLVDSNGVQGCVVGDLPEPCAALNRTNVNVQLLTVDAAVSRRRDAVYQAALLDPHTSSELSTDDIVKLCDDLIEAHGAMLPSYT